MAAIGETILLTGLGTAKYGRHVDVHGETRYAKHLARTWIEPQQPRFSFSLINGSNKFLRRMLLRPEHKLAAPQRSQCFLGRKNKGLLGMQAESGIYNGYLDNGRWNLIYG